MTIYEHIRQLLRGLNTRQGSKHHILKLRTYKIEIKLTYGET